MTEEATIIKTTLGFIREGDKVLLGMKKRGFGAGRWNGFGGKVLPTETVEAAVRRELLEEAAITAGELRFFGLVNFTFEKNPAEIVEVNFFEILNYSGEPTESEEMRPEWFDITELPFHQMWPDDEIWFPLFLAGQKFIGSFHFGPDDIILKKELKEVLAVPEE